MEKNKLKLLHTLNILSATDEMHPVTTAQILQRLNLQGIDAERKSVLRDIAALIDFGYDILLHQDNKLGYYMASREFEDWELKVLMDAAMGACFLTEENRQNLADKISSLSSRDGQKTLHAITPLPSAIHNGDPTTKKRYRHDPYCHSQEEAGVFSIHFYRDRFGETPPV